MTDLREALEAYQSYEGHINGTSITYQTGLYVALGMSYRGGHVVAANGIVRVTKGEVYSPPLQWELGLEEALESEYYRGIAEAHTGTKLPPLYHIALP